MPNPENKLFTKSLPAFLARTQFGQILERVSKHHDRFLVTKNGEATAVILGVDDFLQAIAPTPEALAALHGAGMVPRSYESVKILGEGEFTKKLVIKASAFSASAKEKIEKAGGTAELLPSKFVKAAPAAG